MSALVQKHAPTHDVCAMNNVLCSRCILVALLYCYCRYVPVVPHVFQQYQYITTAPKTCTVYYILYYGSTVNIILYYGSLTVPGIVPHGVWNPSMVNGIIFPTPGMHMTWCKYKYYYLVLVPGTLSLESLMSAMPHYVYFDECVFGRNDHTTMTAPLPVCSAKLSIVGPG